MSARLTALKKADDVGERHCHWVHVPTTRRTNIDETVRQRFRGEECASFQYALSTRAGTDCVGHFLRTATDRVPQTTILSVDGIGAYDHVLRVAMLGRLARMPKTREILPFVPSFLRIPFRVQLDG